MKHILSAPEIYLYRQSVDFRKSINGLAAIIESDTDTCLWAVAHCSCSPTNSATKSRCCTGIKQALLFGKNAEKKPSISGLQKRK